MIGLRELGWMSNFLAKIDRDVTSRLKKWNRACYLVEIAEAQSVNGIEFPLRELRTE